MTPKDNLAHASEDLDRFLGIYDEIIRRIDEHAGGLVAARQYDAPGMATRNGVEADPIAKANIQRAHGVDAAQADKAEIAEIARRMAKDADRLIRIAQAHQPRPSTSLDRARTEGDNTPGCSSCARTFQAKGIRRWVAVFRDGLCSWCYGWRRKHGGLPPLKHLEAHHRGERVMVRA